MTWGFVAVAAVSAVSSNVASNRAKGAANAQQRGIDKATTDQGRQFDVTTEQLSEADVFNRQQLAAGRDQALRTLQGSEKKQREQLQPFAQAGVGALEQQQALLGMGTPEQQQAAFAQFSESPGQKFMRERAEKTLLRNSAAIGGLGGGNVRSALVEQGVGFAAQDFGNQFNRLSDIRSAGQNAATNIGQGALTVGGNKAQTQFNAAQQIGSGAINTAARQGQFGQNTATNIGNLAVQGGNARATGIMNQNNALQSGIAGVTTAFGQSGIFGGAPPPSNQFTQVGGQSPSTVAPFNPLLSGGT